MVPGILLPLRTCLLNKHIKTQSRVSDLKQVLSKYLLFLRLKVKRHREQTCPCQRGGVGVGWLGSLG